MSAHGAKNKKRVLIPPNATSTLLVGIIIAQCFTVVNECVRDGWYVSYEFRICGALCGPYSVSLQYVSPRNTLNLIRHKNLNNYYSLVRCCDFRISPKWVDNRATWLVRKVANPIKCEYCILSTRNLGIRAVAT